MDELIYQFLLQAGFPRASIVEDATLLAPRRGAVPEEASTFVVVDPEDAGILAAIDVVDAVDADTLQVVASRVGHYARGLGGRFVQGFVIRVDPQGRSDAEKVQFYRVWPNPTLQQLSAKTFPDLDGLRVARRLALADAAAPNGPEIVDTVDDDGASEASSGGGGGAGRWVPGILLIVLAVADWYLLQTRGTPLLSVAEALLAIGAAALLTLSSLAGGRR